MSTLTRNAVLNLYQSTNQSTSTQIHNVPYTVQIIGPTTTTTTGLNCKLSDAQYAIKAVVKQPSNKPIIQTNTVITLIKYRVFVNQQLPAEKQFVVVDECNVVSQLPSQLGTPQSVYNLPTSSFRGTANTVQQQQPLTDQLNQLNVRNVQQTQQAQQRTTPQTNTPTSNRTQQVPQYMQSNTSQSYKQYNVPARSSTITKISQLTPYLDNWTIKARVTYKDANIRELTSQKTGAQLKLFAIHLIDELRGEIRMTFWFDKAERYFNMIQTDHCYQITGGQVKMTDKKYNKLPNEYEIHSSYRTEVIPVADIGARHSTSILKNAAELLTTSPETTPFADYIGVVIRVGEIKNGTSTKYGKDFSKRDIECGDTSCKSVIITIWNDMIYDNKIVALQAGTIVSLKHVKLTSYGGCSLTVLKDTQIEIEPQTSVAENLRRWTRTHVNYPYECITIKADYPINDHGTGDGNTLFSYAPVPVTCEELKNKEPSAQLYRVAGVVSHISQNYERPSIYNACIKCNKSIQQQDLMFYPNGVAVGRCSKCNDDREVVPRYTLRFHIMDDTGTLYCNAFNDIATQIIGVSAAEVKQLTEQHNVQNQRIFESIFARRYALHGIKQIFTIRVKPSNFTPAQQDGSIEQRKQYPQRMVTKIEEPDWVNLSSELIAMIESYNHMGV